MSMFRLNHAVLWGIILMAFSNIGFGFPLNVVLVQVRCCIPVCAAAGGGPGQPEEGIRARKGSGKILPAFGSIVINVYGKREGGHPEGMGSQVRWGTDSNEPFHSREELKEHIKKHMEQLKEKGCEEPFLYLRGDGEAPFADSWEVIQAARECSVRKVCFFAPSIAAAPSIPEKPWSEPASSMSPAFIFLFSNALFCVNGNGIFHPLKVEEGHLELLVEWLQTKKQDEGSAVAVQLMISGDVSNQRVRTVLDALEAAGINSVALKKLSREAEMGT